MVYLLVWSKKHGDRDVFSLSLWDGTSLPSSELQGVSGAFVVNERALSYAIDPNATADALRALLNHIAIPNLAVVPAKKLQKNFPAAWKEVITEYAL